MPIDDALKNMSAAGAAANHDSIMRSYLTALKRFNASFNAEMVTAFTRWMKLNQNLETVIVPMPREDIVRLVCRNDPVFKELVDASDISEFVEKSFNIYNRKNHEKMSLVTKISSIIDYEQIILFAKLGKIAIIPDLNYLSLFIKEGARLREYAAEIKEEYSTGALVTISGFKKIDPDFSFNTSALVDFCRYKGKQITGMIADVYDVIAYIRKASTSSDIRQFLFNKLRIYHPEFCCNTKKNSDDDNKYLPECEEEIEEREERIEQLPPDHELYADEDFEELPVEEQPGANKDSGELNEDDLPF